MSRYVLPILLLALLNGCASQATAADPGPATMPLTEQSLSLKLGAQAKLADGSHLTYVSLVNDSRCPPNVQCIWSGDAEIELRWEPKGSGAAKTFSLHTHPLQGKGETSMALGKLHVTLTDLERGIAPKASLTVGPARP